MGKKEKKEVTQKELKITGVIYQDEDGVYRLDIKDDLLSPMDWIVLLEQLKTSMIISLGAEVSKNILAEGMKNKEGN